MKHINNLLSTLFSLLLLVACSAQSDTPPNNTEIVESLDFADAPKTDDAFASFDFLGEMHNSLLNAVVSGYSSNSPLPEEVKDSIALSHLLPVVQKLGMSDEDKEYIFEKLKEYTENIDYSSMMELLCRSSNGIIDYNEVDTNSLGAKDIISYLNHKGVITERELDLLDRLLSIVNFTTDLSGPEMEAEIDELIAIWTEYYGDTDYSELKPHRQLPDLHYNSLSRLELSSNPEGLISGIILNISKHSVSYWNGIPNGPQKGPISDITAAYVGLTLLSEDGDYKKISFKGYLGLAAFATVCSFIIFP